MTTRTNFTYYLSIIFIASMLSVFTLIGFIRWVFNA